MGGPAGGSLPIMPHISRDKPQTSRVEQVQAGTSREKQQTSRHCCFTGWWLYERARALSLSNVRDGGQLNESHRRCILGVYFSLEVRVGYRGGENLGVGVVLGAGMGAFVGADVGVAERVCFCMDI